jgi:hypothetical protein
VRMPSAAIEIQAGHAAAAGRRQLGRAFPQLVQSASLVQTSTFSIDSERTFTPQRKPQSDGGLPIIALGPSSKSNMPISPARILRSRNIRVPQSQEPSTAVRQTKATLENKRTKAAKASASSSILVVASRTPPYQLRSVIANARKAVDP